MIRDKKSQMQFINYNSLSVDRNFDNDRSGRGVYHPADIDGILQFSAKTHPMSEKYNQAVLIYEFKREGKAYLSTGQKMLLEALADAVQNSGGFSLICVARHNVYNPEIDVDGGAGIVTEYYYDGEWRTCHPMSAVKFTDLFLIGAGLKKGGKA